MKTLGQTLSLLILCTYPWEYDFKKHSGTNLVAILKLGGKAKKEVNIDKGMW